jgi:murein DD-endopeptidase MepM/ murein hydrolase activator NlpD
MMHTRIIIAIAVAVMSNGSLGAQALRISPAAPPPGAIVRLTLQDSVSTDMPVRISGEMSGEQLHFEKSGSTTWRAIGPISVDAIGDVTARVTIERASGKIDSAQAQVTLPKPKPSTSGARRRALSVSPRFTQPLDAETQARIDRENAQAREIGRRSHDSPPMWTSTFLRPRDALVTSRFGSGRMFNGTLSSRHLGVDFRGATGAPIHAANKGVVALVGDFFLAGKVVYIDHGGGVVTAYFHMSKPLVAAGDTVQRGQEIGLVGATGRVTGRHLHWSARYGTVTVNPVDLISIGRP